MMPIQLEPSYSSSAEDAVDPGSVTKTLSDMARPGGLGYGIGKNWRREPCDQGHHTRRVRTYRLLHRPGRQPDLFQTQ